MGIPDITLQPSSFRSGLTKKSTSCKKIRHFLGYFAFVRITVKSGNFVTFFAQNIFCTKFCEGTPYFFSGSKFIKKWFRCWHGQFWPWITSKPLISYLSSGDEITLLEGNFVSLLYSWTKTRI